MNDNEQNEQGSEKTFSIVVNGRPREVSERELTYLQVVQLAYPGEVPTENIVFTVTYSYHNGKDGTLVDGQSVKVKDRMVFNVRKTDKS